MITLQGILEDDGTFTGIIISDGVSIDVNREPYDEYVNHYDQYIESLDMYYAVQRKLMT